uniref:F-box domain-containing protein n=1 Tax=Anopheles atroparvus TaxID=41427 RepID=A0A182JLF4_ANOAO
MLQTVRRSSASYPGLATVYGSDLHFDDLPFELMCEIFDYLSLRDIKNAATVCRRWNAIVFSEVYIHRFRLQLNLDQSLPQLKQMVQLLEASDREYYSVVLRANLGTPLTESRLCVVKLMIRLLAHCAESLYFNMADFRIESCVSERLLRGRKLQIIDTRAKYIPLGMGLKESMLRAICEYAVDLVDLVIAEMNIVNPRALEPLCSLRRLKLLLISDYYPYVKPPAPPIDLPNLENLSLIKVTDESCHYFRVDNLKRFFIHSTGTDAPRTMDFITQNITGISRLCLHFTARSIQAEVIFGWLDRFPHLLALELAGVALPMDVLRNLSPTNRLQKLIFVSCHLEAILLDEFTVKLSRLRMLCFDGCSLFHKQSGFHPIHYDDIEQLRQALPRCQIMLDYE